MKYTTIILALFICSSIATITPLNSFIEDASSASCPANTTSWNYGGPQALTCVHDTCQQNLGKLLDIVENLTITVNETDKVWEDSIEINLEVSDESCGAGGIGSGSEECLIDDCYHYGFLQTDENYTLPNATDGQHALSTKVQDAGEYWNSTDCQVVNTTDRQCYYVNLYYFKGTVNESSFDHDMAVVKLEYSIIFRPSIDGEKLISAEMANKTIGIANFNVANKYSSDIKPDPISDGSTLNYRGSVPAEIIIGQQLDLVLQGPSSHQYRDYVQNTLQVELFFDVNGDEKVLNVPPQDITFVNDGGNGTDVRSINFSIKANYLGTFRVRVSCELVSLRRLLSEERKEAIQSQLEITVVQQPFKFSKLSSFESVKFILCLAMGILLVVQSYIMIKRRMQKNKQQKLQQEVQQQYEEAVQDSRA